MSRCPSQWSPNELIHLALTSTITDIGQLTNAQKRFLNRAVKRGWLAKGRGGPFPAIKTVYAHPGFDFDGERERHVEYMKRLMEMDVRRLGW